MEYSNSGYIVLGYVIEKVSGQSYEAFVQENIFAPLGMKDSGYDSNSAIIERRASGYTTEKGQGEIVNAEYVDMTIPHAAGGLYSTTEDLLRWQRGLYGNKVLSADSVRRMTTPFKGDYGYGLAIPTGKRRVFQHGGGIEGFNTQLSYHPDTQMTVVALANLNGTAPFAIAGKLGNLAHGDPVALTSERKETTVGKEQLRKYVGKYSLAPNIDIMVTADNSQLYAQLSGQAKYPVYPESQRRFFFKVVDAQLEFFPEEGPITHVMLFQNGREQKAKRTSDAVRQRAEITLPAETLDRYVGTYQLRPGFDIAITREGSQLMLQATGQRPDPIYAEAERRFFSKTVDATIDFEGPANAQATHLVLKQGAFNGKAPRK